MSALSRALFASLLVLALFLAPPLRAIAQSSDSDREQARALFAAGQAAVDGGRWTDALEAFHRAYELTHVPSALFNAAFALRALGRFQEAEAAFVELLALEGTRPAMRTEAQGYLDEVRARIAHLSITGLPEGAEPLIRLDATAIVDDGTRPLVVPADPGHHLLDVSLEGRQRFEWSGEVVAGQSVDITVLLPFLPELDLGAGAAPPPGGSGNVVEEAWFWVVIGLVAAGIAGGIVAGVVVDDQAQLRPDSGMSVRL